jgi:hypothetical protein
MRAFFARLPGLEKNSCKNLLTTAFSRLSCHLEKLNCQDFLPAGSPERDEILEERRCAIRMVHSLPDPRLDRNSVESQKVRALPPEV